MVTYSLAAVCIGPEEFTSGLVYYATITRWCSYMLVLIHSPPPPRPCAMGHKLEAGRCLSNYRNI